MLLWRRSEEEWFKPDPMCPFVRKDGLRDCFGSVCWLRVEVGARSVMLSQVPLWIQGYRTVILGATKSLADRVTPVR
jgi:hypothetical protein